MARIHELLRQLRASAPELAADIEREVDALSDRRSFGLNFERHTPEAVELPGRKVRVGDKVRVLAARGEAPTVVNRALHRVEVVHRDNERIVATIAPLGVDLKDAEAGNAWATVDVDDLIVVAEFRDPIYPGLVSAGSVEQGGDKPYHVVINGENFHALQALLFTHRGKVDLIYIDPPYNTGARDWKYNDDYVDSDDLYRHSKWLAMMERRLLLAKELLSDSGLLLLSIDDREQARIKLLLDQIYSADNFIGMFIWRTDGNLDNQAVVKTNQEYVLAYARNAAAVRISGVKDPNLADESKLFNSQIRNSVVKNGPKNPVSRITLEPGFPAAVVSARIPARDTAWPHFSDDLVIENGVLQNRVTVESGWASANLVRSFIRNRYAPVVDTKGQETVFEITSTGAIEGVKKRRDEQHHILTVLMNMGTVETAGNQLRALGVEFPYPKPVPLLEYLLSFGPSNGVFLDFFAGSGTATHAALRLNKQDGGSRRTIAVTHNEVSAAERDRLIQSGHRPTDAEWMSRGIFDGVTRPRIQAVMEAGEPDGFDENVEFFTLTYEAPMRVQSNREFGRIAPFLWLRAGSRGRRIASLETGWDVADAYGVLVDLDQTDAFLEAIKAEPEAVVAFVITDEDRLFQAVARELPPNVEPVRMYESYLRNFEIDAMRSVR